MNTNFQEEAVRIVVYLKEVKSRVYYSLHFGLTVGPPKAGTKKL